MQIKYSYSGSTVRPIKFCEKTTSDILEPAVYILNFNPLSGYSLNLHKNKFTLPSKVYGNHSNRTRRIISAFRSRNKSTGVLLSGDKGSGKTMLSQSICNEMIENGYPVVLVSEPYCGTQFDDFMEMLGECVVVFDEFAKVYKEQEDQAQMLGFFDGNSSSKRLSIVTENSTYKINEFMLDRPGRFFYHFQYSKLTEEVIKEFCTDKSLNANAINDIIEYSRQVVTFSFDILNAVCEEVTRSGLTPLDVFNDLNIPRISPTPYDHAIIKKVINSKGTQENLNIKINLSHDRPHDHAVIPDYLLAPESYDEKDSACSWVALASSTIKYRKGNDIIIEYNGTTVGLTLVEVDYSKRDWAAF